MKRLLKRSVLRVSQGPLRKVLSLLDLFAIGYGDLGSSIYYALGITAIFALGATPIALFLAGLVFICTALTYAEMTSCYHESGGSASFARHAFNDLISFIAGWGLLLDYIVTIAISAFSVAPYLAYFLPQLTITEYHIGFTLGIIFLLLIMNILGVKGSVRISLVLTGFTIVTQIVIIVIAAVWLLDVENIISHLRINVIGESWSPSWKEFWKGTAMAMVAYTGIESIAQLSAEVKKPEKTTPRAVQITMYVLVAMYIGLSVVALSALTPTELGSTYVNDPVAGIVTKLPFGSTLLSPWLGLLAAVLLFVAANAGLIGASRLSFNLGEYYQLPKTFYTLGSRFKTPYISLLVFAFFSCLIVLASRGELSFLADLYNFGAMIAFTSAHFSLIAIRIKKPDLKRPFKAPLNISFGKFSLPLTAIVGGMATISVWVLVVITKPAGRYLGIGWMIMGSLFYFYYRRKSRLEVIGSVTVEKLVMPKGYPVGFKKILVVVENGSTNLDSVVVACELAKYFKAELSVLKIQPVASSMPIDVNLALRQEIAAQYFEKVDALAKEAGVDVQTRFEPTRYPAEFIANVVKKEHIDLVLFSLLSRKEKKNAFIKELRQKVFCRLWICYTPTKD